MRTAAKVLLPTTAIILRDAGYHVLALYFWGQPHQQQTLAEVPLEFFAEALTWIDANRGDGPLTLIGSSKGAELVGNLAVRYPEIDHIVLYTPTEYTYAGLNFERDQKSTFTWEGTPVGFVRFRSSAATYAGLLGGMMLGLPLSYRAAYVESVENASNADQARIDFAAFQGDGLLFAGSQDAMWQADQAALAIAAANPSLEAVVYPDAGHLFHQDITQLGPVWETMLGGTIEGNRRAKEKSDALLLERLATWHS